MRIGADITKSVFRLATGCRIRGSNPGEGEIFRALQPNQSAIQWVQGLFPGGKAAGTWRCPPTTI
jgi:hypothetical protein